MIIGIDPGKNGAIATLDGVAVAVLAKLGKYTDKEVLTWLKEAIEEAGTPPRCALEKVSSSPQMGVVSSFSFGREFGRLQAILAALTIDTRLVSPQRWQKSLGCMSGGDKNVTKQKAMELFPDQKVTHVTADALLIAEYCRRNEKELFCD